MCFFWCVGVGFEPHTHDYLLSYILTLTQRVRIGNSFKLISRIGFLHIFSYVEGSNSVKENPH